ncbi:MAG TPA: hypothetical protein VGJ05_06710 [Fimbriiglobus sp.]|jgi:hypothetical protein
MFSSALSGMVFISMLGGIPAANQDIAQYHVIVFGGQRDILRPGSGHTWATFTRTTTRPDGTRVIDPVTISWMPTDLMAHRHLLRATTGVNLSLEATLCWMCGPRCKVAAFGPYEISPCLYEKALAQAANLESGCVKYSVFNLKPDVDHCIHAVTRTDFRWERAANPNLTNGMHGTRRVAKSLLETGLGTRPACPPNWLVPALGLDKFPVSVHLAP